jgi:programmed cell death protein 5
MDLEELKQQRLQELQNELYKKQLEQQSKVQEQVEQLESLVKQYMTPEAINRYGTLKSAHQEKAIHSLAILAQLIQQGKIKEKITDEQYKALLLRMTEKKEFRIKK